MQLKISKYNKGKWRYILDEDFSVELYSPNHVINNVDHPYFTVKYIGAFKFILTIKKNYAWDGATKVARPLQTNDLKVPTLFHDVFCQMTAESLIPWNPWRKFGDDLFKHLYKQEKEKGYEPYKARMNIIYTAVRANSLLQGAIRKGK